MSEFSHIDDKGKANMVDIGFKKDQLRKAKAEGFIRLSDKTIQLIRENNLKKGDVLTVAEIAGIMGGKKTSELIPLCHPLQISKIDVTAKVESKGIKVTGEARCIGKTGIEMEALTAVHIALLTIYDMCKAVDKKMVMEDIRLVEKTKTDIS